MSGLELSVAGIGIFVGFIVVSAIWPSKAGKASAPNEDDDGNSENKQPKGEATADVWYHVLNVQPSATQTEVKEAYKRQMSQYHPDKVAALGPELQRVANEMSKKINAAYQEGLRRTEGR